MGDAVENLDTAMQENNVGFQRLDFYRYWYNLEHARFMDYYWSVCDKNGTVGMLRSKQTDWDYLYCAWM